jgi:peptidyl-prolyl cis-trans isomerase C
VILLEDQRDTSPPPVADVEDEIRQALVRKKFETVMEDLKAKTKVEIVGKPAE